MIISVTSLKGGTGKSTIAQNLAVCLAHSDYKVLLVDTDTNGSSVRWSGFRADSLPTIPTVALNDSNALRKNMVSLHKSVDIIVVDGTPALSELASTLLLIADLVLIPIKPSVLDVWATEKFLSRYEDTKIIKEGLRAYFVLTQFDSRHKLGSEVSSVLQEDLPLPVLESKLHHRVAYSECVAEGKGVYEYKDRKASAEVVALTNEVVSILQSDISDA